MTITETAHPNDVDRILRDRHFRVVEADADASLPVDRFRAGVSRFAEGVVHAERRRTVETLLDGLDPGELATSAGVLARQELASCVGLTLDERAGHVARRVPVLCLAERLGFSDRLDLPTLVAAVAAVYPAEAASMDTAGTTAVDGADAAVERLLAAAGDGNDAVLRLQLLVQAYAATAALIESAVRRSAAEEDAARPVAALIDLVLREDPPVPATRRVAPDGAILTLPLDSPPGSADTLAFGAGARACPAPRHALAIAAAVIAELLAC
jgi:hypothetical protein